MGEDTRDVAGEMSPPGTPSAGGSGPWLLRLVCCGRDDGWWRCQTWEAASDLRKSYIAVEDHERSAVLTWDPAPRNDPAPRDYLPLEQVIEDALAAGCEPWHHPRLPASPMLGGGAAKRPSGLAWIAHVVASGGFCLVHCPHYAPREATASPEKEVSDG